VGEVLDIRSAAKTEERKSSMAKKRKAKPSRAKMGVRDLNVPTRGSAEVRGGGDALYALAKLSEAKAADASREAQDLAAQQAQLVSGRRAPSPLGRLAT
jgi:hypothetical protein